jgi:glycosyltransferase involved in cell wall biosynthesis
MKFLYITNTRIPTEKAHGIAVMKMCEAFARQGDDISLVVPWRRNPIKEPAFAFYGMEGQFSIQRLPSLDLLGLPIIAKAAFFVQALSFYLSVYVWALWQDRRAVIYTTDAPLVPLACLGFTTIFECHAVPKRRKLFFSLAKHASRIIVTSEEIGTMFVEAGTSAEKIARFPNGVDLGIFDTPITRAEARKSLGLDPDAFIALYTGNFTTYGEDKGVADSIRALAHAPDVTFLAVGGSDADRARYTRLAEECGVAKRVRLVGNVKQAELAVYQKAADALLMPYPDRPHYRHNMSPMKMFEYMAADRPIVASDLPTIREVLDDDTAYIVPPGDPAGVAQALKEIRQDSEESARRAGAARTAGKSYSWEERACGIRAIL